MGHVSLSALCHDAEFYQIQCDLMEATVEVARSKIATALDELKESCEQIARDASVGAKFDDTHFSAVDDILTDATHEIEAALDRRKNEAEHTYVCNAYTASERFAGLT